MHLGIEIGGTKLQLAIGEAGQPPRDVRRLAVTPEDGAGGILAQLEVAAAELLDRHHVRAVGVGFGGPVDRRAGRVIKSHQIDGWDDFDLAQWCREKLGRPAVIGNDCDVAALAEARYGAGQGANPLFYVTVGTGIGGGLVIDGDIFHGHGQAVAEIGHLRLDRRRVLRTRPAPGADLGEEGDAASTIESAASGWSIAAAAREQIRRFKEHATPSVRPEAWRIVEDVTSRCGRNLDALTARHLDEAARAGNALATWAFSRAATALGYGIATVITLISPEVVVLGGGVSSAGAAHFWTPLEQAVTHYVFPPLRGSYQIMPAALGGDVVLHGALAIAEGMS